MRAEVDELIEAYLGLRDVSPEACPWPAFPEPGGVLPWARTPHREELYWLTDGHPDEWVVVAADLPETTVHTMTTTEFLLSWVEGTLGDTAVSSWPAVQPGVEPFFRPLAGPETVTTERLMVWFAESSLPYDERVAAVREIFGPAKKRERGISVMGVSTRIERADGWDLMFSSQEPGSERFEEYPPQSLGITLPPSDIDDAKERVAQLSERIGAPITKAYRSGKSPIWPDLVTAV